MSSTSLIGSRRHNRRFPGKLGKRPDLAKDRREGALARHNHTFSVEMSKANGDGARCERLRDCVYNTRKNLGLSPTQ